MKKLILGIAVLLVLSLNLFIAMESFGVVLESPQQTGTKYACSYGGTYSEGMVRIECEGCVTVGWEMGLESSFCTRTPVID